MQKVSGNEFTTFGLCLGKRIYNEANALFLMLKSSHFLFQARYRQYFEEEPDPNMDAGMIPIETQVLMQEVLTDGMAFCSLM